MHLIFLQCVQHFLTCILTFVCFYYLLLLEITEIRAISHINLPMTFAVLCAKLSRVNVNMTTGVLAAEFRHLRLHRCGFWNRTIARTLQRGRRSLTMTLYTTLSCSSNRIRHKDEGAKYFIAIRHPWEFTANNYNLRPGDKVIRRRHGAGRLCDRFTRPTST